MPSLDLVAFITGIALLVIAVLGGGIVLEKVQIPTMTTFGRAGAFVIGCLLLVLGVWLHNNPTEPHKEQSVKDQSVKEQSVKERSDSPVVESSSNPIPAQPTTYTDPLYEGKRLDVCYLFADDCDDKPANEWCKYKGHTSFKSYETENVGERGIETIIMGTKEICKEKICTAFKVIVCN